MEDNKNTDIALLPKPTTERQTALTLKTPNHAIDLKQGFVYAKHQYVDDIFHRLYPVHDVEVVSQEIVKDYWIITTVKITATDSGGNKMSKVGSGGARLQISKVAKDAFIASGKAITPFDFIDMGNDYKSSLTKAIKNTQERFGIAGDVTQRLVLTEEQMNAIQNKFEELLSNVEDLRDKTRFKQGWNDAKSTKDKIKILENLTNY